jgi:hypothetical protein
MTYANSWFGAVSTTTGSAGQFGSAETATITTGVVAKPASGSRNLLIAGEGGVDDDLDNITGYSAGDMVVIRPSSDSVTITVKDSGDATKFNLQGVDFTMDSEHDAMILLNIGSDAWVELSRAANGV